MMAGRGQMVAAARHGTGILLMIAAVTCFSALDATAKWASQSIPPLQTAGLRYLSGFVFIAALVRPWSRVGVWRPSSLKLQCARGLALVASTIFAFTALHYLPLGQATAITFASPLLVVLLAGPVLGEWPGPHRVGAALVGFVGVVVAIRPGLHMHPAVFIALLTACANACYALITRRLAGRDRPKTTLFWSGLVGAAATAPVLPLVWTGTSAIVWLAIGLMGLLATGGHYLLILANERAPASVLAPFTYTQLAGATCFGFLVFGTVPDGTTLLGAAIIAGSGIALLRAERRRKD